MKIKTMTSLLALVVGLSSIFTLTNFTSPDANFPPRWEKLGTKRVNYALDRDEIIVTAKEGLFDALKIIVKGGAINLHRVVIHFGNGETKEIEANAKIPAGGSSPVIDLPGNNRIIQKVVFWYDTKNYASKKAVVQLWGRH